MDATLDDRFQSAVFLFLHIDPFWRVASAKIEIEIEIELHNNNT